MAHDVVWLRYAGQHLGLVPTQGGGVAAWQIDRPQGRFDLWRAGGASGEDRYALANFAMLPWSNRISHGGFAHEGHFHAMAPNRAGEPYPIHGDGWLQRWDIAQPADDTLVMSLESRHFDGNPYHYRALQQFTLVAGGLNQSLEITHLGERSLPYGLGLHPWFPRTPGTRLRSAVRGVWLSGADPIPTRHTMDFPDGWDLNAGVDVNGSLIDNAYTGWSGSAQIDWPEHALRLTMRVPELAGSADANGYCLLYRPPQGPAFCFEPVTHPIDAFHLRGRPGLQTLQQGEVLRLHVEWRVQELAA